MSAAPVMPSALPSAGSRPARHAVVLPFRQRPAGDSVAAAPAAPSRPGREPVPDVTELLAPLSPPAETVTPLTAPEPDPVFPATRPARQARTVRPAGAPDRVHRSAPSSCARPGRPAAAAGLRLTARGRRVLATAVLLLAAGAGWLGVHVVQAQTTIPDSAPAVVVVQPGDSLWTIARRIAPQADTRSVVDQLRTANGLPDAGSVHPGQRIVVHP